MGFNSRVNITYYKLKSLQYLMVAVEQLRHELYGIAQKKLALEKELKVMNSFISTLKKELEIRAI